MILNVNKQVILESLLLENQTRNTILGAGLGLGAAYLGADHAHEAIHSHYAHEADDAKKAVDKFNTEHPKDDTTKGTATKDTSTKDAFEKEQKFLTAQNAAAQKTATSWEKPSTGFHTAAYGGGAMAGALAGNMLSKKDERRQ